MISRRRRERPEEPISELRMADIPPLRHPVVIASFEGWNDAGDAASTATAYFARAWKAQPFAEIDPEEFVDFTEHRPEVRIVEGETRQIIWPTTVFASASPEGSASDFVVVRGYEPQMRWKAFCDLVVDAVRQIGAESVITLGSLLAEVAHTSPVPIVATSNDPETLKRYALSRSRYEGPTGIVGVLHAAFAAAGIPSLSLWASVPYYVPQITSPKAALALVTRAESVIGVEVDRSDLEELATSYEAEVDALVADDDDISAYVARLQEIGEDPDEVTYHDIADEVERFLRDHRKH
ncbi:MAG TPA: PAC2 family protein [Acidimicrobiales bacterium]|nr:PAC2 family protein [Acidimicrobiales bacterium]